MLPSHAHCMCMTKARNMHTLCIQARARPASVCGRGARGGLRRRAGRPGRAAVRGELGAVAILAQVPLQVALPALVLLEQRRAVPQQLLRQARMR